MKITVYSGDRFPGYSCGKHLLLANLYLSWDEITERNLVPHDFDGGDFDCVFLPTRSDHFVLTSQRLDNTRLVASCCVCVHHLVSRVGWYYCHGDDIVDPDLFFGASVNGRVPKDCEDLRSMMLDAIEDHLEGKGAV